jgi:hypothetical protein
MANLSDHSENLLLDWLMTNGTATRPTAWYVALYTAAPSDSGGGTEVTGGSYARTAATFAAASSGATSNTGTITFPTASGSWGTVTHIGIFDASTSGNLLWHGAATANKTVGSGDIYRIPTGDLDLTLA